MLSLSIESDSDPPRSSKEICRRINAHEPKSFSTISPQRFFYFLLSISLALFPDFHTRCRGEERGLSRKHIIESVQASLKRLQLDYIDVVIIHKADSMCPMEGNISKRWPAHAVHNSNCVCRGRASDELRH